MSNWEEETGSFDSHQPVERNFDTPGVVTLRVENIAGVVEVRTHDRPTTEVVVAPQSRAAARLLRDLRIEERRSGEGHSILVEVQRPRHGLRDWSLMVGDLSVRVSVSVPTGAGLEVSTVSAAVVAEGRFAQADVRTVSGEVTLEQVTGRSRLKTVSGRLEALNLGEADVHSASGEVRIDALPQGGRITTASGDVVLGRAGERTKVHTASGDVRLAEAGEDVNIETVSGDQRIERAGAGDFVLRAVSGDIFVGVVPGTLVRLDVGSTSGRVQSEIQIDDDRPPMPEGGDGGQLSLRAKTVSGDISLERAS